MVNKYSFLSSPEVKKFIDFLKFDFFNSKKEIENLLNGYRWPDNSKGFDFETTFQKVAAMRTH